MNVTITASTGELLHFCYYIYFFEKKNLLIVSVLIKYIFIRQLIGNQLIV